MSQESLIGSSITSVGDHSSSALIRSNGESNPDSEFNWREIVALEMPGANTVAGRARLESLPALVEGVENWGKYHNLDNQRAKVCAYSGSVMTLTPTNYPEAFLVAIYSLWLFNLDNFLDQMDYSTLKTPADTLPSARAKIVYFDIQVSYILQPLYLVGGLTVGQARGCQAWPDKLALLDPASFSSSPIAVQLPDELERSLSTQEAEAFRSEKVVLSKSLMLGQALAAIYHELQSAWQSLKSDPNSSNPSAQRLSDQSEPWVASLERFSEELVTMLAQMRAELYQSLIYQDSRKLTDLPDLEDYLERTKFTIAVRAVATVVSGFEGVQAASNWQNCQPALNNCARIVRLANDVGNYWTELQEQKINSITIALALLGFTPMGDYKAGSLEVTKAMELVRARLAAEITNFSLKVVDKERVQTNPLLYHLRNEAAFGLSMYDKGDYIEPTV
jgi:hypothetical protein